MIQTATSRLYIALFNSEVSTGVSSILRTFRGVPDLEIAGVCYAKDAIYLRGYRAIVRAIEEDQTVLARLIVGTVALEQLPDLAELGIVSPPGPPQ